MATPQSVIHGSTRTRDVVVLSSLLGLCMLHLWQLPRLAAEHGGLAFVGAWLLGLFLLALPLLLVELMLGRRSRRSPLEGLAFLTREADVRRFWRAAAWGAALAGLLALAAVALVAGGSIQALARDVGLVSVAVTDISATGLALPLGTGGLFLFAAALSLLKPELRSWLLLGGLVLVLLLLALAAVAGLGAAEDIYRSHALSSEDWRHALRLSLLSLGGGLGVLWLCGMRLSREAALGRLALGLVLLQAVLAALLLPALANLAPNVVEPPAGLSLWTLLGALILVALFSLKLIAEPLLLRLVELGLGRLPAVVLVFGAAAVLAEVLWFSSLAPGVRELLTGLSLLLLLVLLGFSLFAGWGMKISHARKELALPSEAIYNVWRVAVRLAVPLVILWLLTLYLP